MVAHNKTSSFLGLLAGRILAMFGKRKIEPTSEDLKKAEFKASTQRIGFRFTRRLRNAFRARWIKRM